MSDGFVWVDLKCAACRTSFGLHGICWFSREFSPFPGSAVPLRELSLGERHRLSADLAAVLNDSGLLIGVSVARDALVQASLSSDLIDEGEAIQEALPHLGGRSLIVRCDQDVGPGIGEVSCNAGSLLWRASEKGLAGLIGRWP